VKSQVDHARLTLHQPINHLSHTAVSTSLTLPLSLSPLLPQVPPLVVGFVGTGLIGKVTLQQVAAQAPALQASAGLDIRIAGRALPHPLQ
jgi:hypothetical protein